MNSRDHYHSMTDEQLAEWSQLSASVHKLTSEVAEARARVDAVQLAAQNENDSLRRALSSQSKLILEIHRKYADQQAAARRANASLVVSLKAIDTLLKALVAPNMADATSYFPGDVFRAMHEAGEVLKAYGIPF